MSKARELQLNLDGGTYLFLFGIRAMEALKERWGIEEDREIQAKLATAGSSQLVDLLWAGLLEHHRDLSRDDVLSLVDRTGLEDLPEQLMGAMEGSMPPPPKGGAKAQRKTPTR